jgi:peptidyl-prolyl cis-trans isomerase SurA
MKSLTRLRELYLDAWALLRLVAVALCSAAFSAAFLPLHAQQTLSTPPVVIDRVVAVVNNQAILASDIQDEIRLSVLDPVRGGMGTLTPQRALQQLIGRTLIQQQIRQEDEQAVAPTPEDLAARLKEIRTEIPACVRENCASDEGWKAFLAAHDLSEERVEAYLRYRVEILRFIEERFRQGIRITPQEIENYYRNTLLPQYSKPADIPPLDKVSQRIQEILLQQHVNALFDDWLNNLRKQGDIEILDQSLESPDAPEDQNSSQSLAPVSDGRGGR